MKTKGEEQQQEEGKLEEKTPEQIAAEEAEAEEAFAAGTAKVLNKGEAQPAEDEPGTKKGPKTTDQPAAETATGDAEAKAKAEADAKAKAEADAKAKAEADAKAAAEAEWEGVPAVVRKRLEELGDIPSQISKLAGHIGGFKRQIDTITATAKAAAEKKDAPVPTKIEIEAALADPEKWKALKADFPEWMEPVEAELLRMRKDFGEALQKAVSSIPKQQEQREQPEAVDAEAISAAAEERAYVRLKHPDWKALCAQPEFQTWLDKTATAEVKALAASEKAEDAISLFDAYKDHRKKLADQAAAKERNEKRLKGAVVPEGSAEPPVTGISDEEAFERGLKRVRGGHK